MICVHFHAQVFNTFHRIKTLNTILFLNHLQISSVKIYHLHLRLPFQLFVTLSEILFAFNQLTGCSKSALAISVHFLIELLRHIRFASSAVVNLIKNRRVIELILAGCQNLLQWDQYYNHLWINIMIRQIWFNLIIWNSTNPKVI